MIYIPAGWTSQQRSVGLIERAIGLSRRAGFRRIRLRGDCKFSQTEHFDRWDSDEVIFQFGYDAKKNLTKLADNLTESRWKNLKRPPKCKPYHE